MGMNTFSIGESFTFAWQTFMKRAWFFVGATVVLIIVNILVSEFTKLFDTGPLTIVAGIVNIVAGALIGIGATAFFLKAHDHAESVVIKDLWHPEHIWNYLGTSIISGLIAMILFVPFIVLLFARAGTAFLSGEEAAVAAALASVGVVGWVLFAVTVAASLYLSTMLMFGTYTVVDRALDPISALKESVRITKDVRFKIILFILLLCLLNLAGAVLLFVGLLVTIPLTMLALMHIYRSLSPRASVSA